MAEHESEVNLENQLAVVTGGGRGIGREVALHLARAGASVVVTARTLGQLEKTGRLIQSEGGRCQYRQLDVTDEAAVTAAFREIEAEWGGIDLLVNNAGVSGAGGMPWEVETADWWRTVEVNLLGPYLCSKAVIPGMIKRNGGRIIMVGSNMAFWPFPQASAYSCSKAGLVRLGDNLAKGLEEQGIKVFTISPGLVKTEMTRDVPEEFVGSAGWTTIERPADLCVQLASGRADALSGRYIHASAHDLEELIARADDIVEKDLQTMRLVE